MQKVFLSFLITSLFILPNMLLAGETLDEIKRRGFIRCGVNTGLAGFGIPDSQGKWSGLDVDYCRAFAVALFNDLDKVVFTPLNAQQRFLALQSGEIDVLSRNTTWTLSRDTKLGLNFTAITFYDGQGFMIRKEQGVTSALELDGATVCVQPGTTTELNLTDFFRANNMTFEPVVIDSLSEVLSAYDAKRCDVITTDASGLASNRLSFSDPEEHIILSEIISKEPLGPAVRHGDDQWLDIVKWVIYATIEAEELNLTSENVERLVAVSPEQLHPKVQRILGIIGNMGASLGLRNDWAYNVIEKVGNYGEIFERNVGIKTPIGLERGLNALWVDGGLIYAPPIR